MMNMQVFPQNFNQIFREEELQDSDSENYRYVNYYPGVLFLLLVFLLFTWGMKNLLDPHTLPIKHVAIRGDFHYLSPVSLEERVSNVVRGGFFNVNVEIINQTLLEEPWVRSVTVKRVWPDSITVYIKEQVAVALWRDQGLINDEAELFTPEVNTYPENLPRLSGPDGTNAQVLDTYRYIEGILPEAFKIRELILSERRAWEARFENGVTLLLGRSDLKKRIERFSKHVPSELGNRMDNISYIDIRYTNGFSILWSSDATSELNNKR